jgi:TP901 family phage tail tape measure protein
MAGGEAFTILAILEARDRISGVMNRVDATLDRFAGTSERAAESARVAGTAIDESLLQTASGADAAQVASARLEAARTRLRIATMEQAGAERELLTVQRDMLVTGGNNTAVMERQSAAAARMAAAERDAAVASRELAAAEARQTAVGDAMTGSTTRAGASTAAAGSAAAAGSSGFKTATKSMLGIGIAAGAIVYASLKAATSFQTLSTRLVTSAGESRSALKGVEQGMIQISNETGVMANDVAKNMYVVESGGYHGAAGLEVLRAATEGAKIEGAEFGTVANAVTDVLNDYHLSANKSADVTSQLVKAVSYGKTNFQLLSSSMANVLPLAGSLGIKMNDVVGILANMTAHGMTAARASFNIANAMRSLSAPTNVMGKELKLFGLTAHDVQASLGTRGLAGTMQWLSQVAKDGAPKVGQTYNEALKKLMGTATGFTTALMSTGENTNKVNEAIKGIGEASADANGNVEGFSDTQKTLAFQLDKAKAAIHNAGIAIGTAFLPAITKIATEVAKLAGPMANWIEHHKKLTTYVLGAAIALGLLAGAIMVIGAIIGALTSMVGLVVLAIVALGAALIYAYNHSARFRQIVQTVGQALKVAWDATIKAVAVTINWFSKNVVPGITKAISAVFAWFSGHSKTFTGAWNSVFGAIQSAAQWFKTNVLDWIQARINDLVTWFKSHSEEIEQIWHVMWDVIKTAAQVWWDGFKTILAVVLAGWKTTWGIIKDTVKLVWGVISDTISMAMHTILNIIGVILDLITGHWGKAWKDVKKLVSQGIHDVIKTITDLTSNFGTLLYDAGRNVIKGLVSGIKSMVGNVKDAIGSVTSTIKNHLPWSPAKEGPLSGGGAPEIGGANITKLLAKGILSGKANVKAAMSQVTGAALGPTGVGPIGAGGAIPGMPLGINLPIGATRGTGNVLVMQFDFKGAQVMGEQAMDQLADKVGRRVATRILPAGGVKIRM